MPVSMHKILLHGAVTASSLTLPIGMMSEEGPLGGGGVSVH